VVPDPSGEVTQTTCRTT